MRYKDCHLGVWVIYFGIMSMKIKRICKMKKYHTPIFFLKKLTFCGLRSTLVVLFFVLFVLFRFVRSVPLCSMSLFRSLSLELPCYCCWCCCCCRNCCCCCYCSRSSVCVCVTVWVSDWVSCQVPFLLACCELISCSCYRPPTAPLRGHPSLQSMQLRN